MGASPALPYGLSGRDVGFAAGRLTARRDGCSVGYVIGIDEAGYGPNLGPLIVAASVWRVPHKMRAADLYDCLSTVITQELAGRNGADQRLKVADSKQVYANKDLRSLERGVHVLLHAAGVMPTCWTDLWSALVPRPCDELRSSPWHVGYDECLPLAAEVDDIRSMARRVAVALDEARIQLVTMRARAVFPARFNVLTDESGTKGMALSRLTIGLLGELIDELPAGAVEVVCDKHGGRNAYGSLLQEHFVDWLIEVRRESPAESEYRWGPRSGRVETRFCCRAERFLPTALASMTAKYLREMAMRAFNRFWCARLPELKPTAGYPIDARRFRQQIAPLQASLGIEDRHLWRDR